jgi:hypothetical protein
MIKIWTFAGIDALQHEGWFYGFVRDNEGRLLFGEIFPGYGVAAQFPYPWWNPKTWWWVVRDILRYRPTP